MFLKTNKLKPLAGINRLKIQIGSLLRASFDLRRQRPLRWAGIDA